MGNASTLINRPRVNGVWIFTALGLLSGSLGLSLLSKRFGEDRALIEQPVLWMVAVYVGCGISYFLPILKKTIGKPENPALDGSPVGLKNLRKQPVLLLIVVTGFLMRLFMLFSTPILENDFYRYLWDGAQIAAGCSPYRFSPKEAAAAGERIPKELGKMAREAGAVVGRINHPELRTIYPPVLEAFFFLAYGFRPFSLTAWRLLLLGADLSTLALLWIILGQLGKPSHWSYLYWCNPLLVKEIYNSGHMDVLLFPFLLSALICMEKKRPGPAAVFLAMATGVKIWPVLLLPLLLGAVFPDVRKLIRVVSVFGGILLVMAVVTGFPGPLDASSGLLAYSRSWENNSSFFRLVEGFLQWLLPLMEIHPGHAQWLSRMLVGGMLLLVTGIVLFTKKESPDGLYGKALILVAALFLVSPTQFPWYYTWLLPFLAIRPQVALTIPTLLLPLYYLRYYLEPRGLLDLLPLVIALEFIPVWLLLAPGLKGKGRIHAGR